MAISMLKIRRPLRRLIFNMGIAIPGKTVFLIETAPWLQSIGHRQMKDETRNIYVVGYGAPYTRCLVILLKSVLYPQMAKHQIILF